MEEHDVFLDTQEDSLLLQYPLNTELPSLVEIKTKSEDTFAETKAETSAGQISYRSVESSTINKYFILSVGEEITGVPVKKIFQLRPFLPETDEILKKMDKKETKVFAMNETQEEFENRMKNPNYVVEKVNKMPWKNYQINKETAAESMPQQLKAEMARGAPIKHSHYKEAHTPMEKIKETIYNARVVNMSELARVYPTVPMSDISQAVSEMTIEFLDRYVLKPEYFNDLAPMLINILNRMKNTGGVLTLTKEEIINSSEEFNYVLSQVSHKEAHYYRLKGYFE
ncbi:hypothetical protein NEMIN01_0793 [Nematocida minor]|uniref:uncharacterized protein n=1 Tax=Nematocida minor TaxID=1912983 RepID=UPI00221E413A|nr:uncharacterized protein NEMIN01_0793 [Nematocida minor]KAI5190008.1 hypothetical protein NEMIN01_0793 [Nematocida minor]